MTDRRVGLLMCDHVDVEARDVAGDYPEMFSDLLADQAVDLVGYDVVAGELPADPSECDGWITTGSRASVYDGEPWIADLSGFVRRVHEAELPFVGICFGHQLIAQALGGEVARAPGGWGVGARVAVVSSAEPWMQPPARRFRVLYSHQDQVVALPPGGRVLAAAPHAPVAMMAVGDHLLGIQGHPEFPAGYLRVLLERRRGATIPGDVVDDALGTLELPLHRQVVAEWIARFFSPAAGGLGAARG